VSSTINGLQKTDVWESRKQMPAYLVMMAVGNFIKTTDELSTLIKDSFVAYTYDTFRVETLIDSVLVLKDSIVSHPVTKYRLVKQDMLNGVEVSYYLEPSYSPFAQQIFKHTPEMIDFFGAKLGVSYPWEKYAQVVVHDFVSGAMENTSATVHNESIQKYPRELLDASNDDIIAHELFHQWFGDLVTCASWTHLVLNEGFATYGEQLWHEFKYGKDAAQLKWYNALNRYLKFAEDKHDDPIVQLNYLQPDDLFNAITYQKGSLVLHLLRSELGDEAFFTGLRQYLTEFSLANAEIEDLRKVFEKVSGKDLRPFFAQWFLRGGHPELEIRYSFIDSTKLVSLTIEQKQSAQTGLFQFPLHFKVIHGQKQKAYTFDINRKTETFFVSKLDPEESSYPTIVVDPDGLFIGEINDNKPLIDHIRSYYHASGYIEKLRALTALSAIQQTTDTARLVLLAALNDADANIRVKAMDIIKWDDSRNRFVARNILVQMAESDASVKVRAKSVLVLSEWKDNNLLAFFRTKCLDSSYTIAAHALEGLYKINETEALGMASILEKSARRDLFRKVAELYSKSGNLTDESFFSSSMMTQFGRNRIALINEYSDFCTRLRDTLLYEKAISVLNERAYNDKQPMVRAAAVVGLNNILQQQLNDVPTIKNAGQKAALQASAASLKESLQRIVDQELSKQAIEFLKTRGILQTPVNGVE
jgi:aminopeptidase N